MLVGTCSQLYSRAENVDGSKGLDLDEKEVAVAQSCTGGCGCAVPSRATSNDHSKPFDALETCADDHILHGFKRVTLSVYISMTQHRPQKEKDTSDIKNFVHQRRQTCVHCLLLDSGSQRNECNYQ
jgi:RNase H-fold protein (predicted Holliday junction resolvase)